MSFIGGNSRELERRLMLRIDSKTGLPLSWVSSRNTTFSNGTSQHVFSLGCGHQLKTNDPIDLTRALPYSMICRECHAGRPKLARVLTDICPPLPSQFYLHNQIVLDWEEGFRFALIGGSPSERTMGLLWAIATAIECGAKTVGMVHWRPTFSRMKTSPLHSFISCVYGEPVGTCWHTKEAKIIIAHAGDRSLEGLELDFIVIDEANGSEKDGERQIDLSSVTSRCRPGPERIVIAPRSGSRFASQWSLISVE